jgi:hypothetical protein
MKKVILAFIMFFIMTSASFADSNVYITQSGANLELDILINATPSPGFLCPVMSVNE